MQRALILAALVAAPITARSTPSGSPGPGRVGERVDRVEFTTSDRLKLAGTFYQPKDDRAPGAVLVHDAGGNRTQLDAIAGRLQRLGFAVLTFDVRGHGESKSSKADWNQLDEKGRKTLWAQGVRDVRAASEWVLKQKSVHSTKLSLLGYGSGCALVARHAKEDENVVSLTLLSPKPSDLGFDVRGDIEYLIGLPTYVVAARNNHTEAMVEEANKLAGGNPYIELFLAKPKATDVLDDHKVPAKVTGWMSDVVRPKRGRP